MQTLAKKEQKNSLPDSPKAGIAYRFIVACLLFVLINTITYIALSQSHQNLNPQELLSNTLNKTKEHSFSWWTAHEFISEKQALDIALIGSSQMGSATFSADAQFLQKSVDVLKDRHAVTLESDLKQALKQNVTVFNCSQGGFMVSDAYMMCKALFYGSHKPKMVIIGVSPRDFMDNSVVSPATTDPFQFYLPCVNLGNLKNYSFSDPLAQLGWLLNKDLPLKQVQQKLLPNTYLSNANKEESQSTSSAEANGQNGVMLAFFNAMRNLQPGKLLIPANIPPGLIDNTKEYKHRYRDSNPPVYKQEIVYFNTLLKYLNDSHIQVLVVGMPSLSQNRALLTDDFWTNFREMVTKNCKDNNAKWLDLSQEDNYFTVDNYLDTVHLNATGGAKLFKKISAQIVDDQKLKTVLSK